MSGNFRQIHLGDMEDGLAKEFAYITLSPVQITNLTGIRFEVTQDDFDYCMAALLTTADGQQFGLRSYYRTIRRNTTELIGSALSKDVAGDAKKFLEALDISPKFIFWTIGDKKE